MPEQTLIRRATRTDLSALESLELRCFESDRLSRRSFAHFIKAEHSQLLVCEEGANRLAGYVLVLFRQGTNLARIYSIAVDPDFRRKGVSRALMLMAERIAEEASVSFLRLEVSVLNTGAKQLYTALGYHPIAKLSEYYGDGSDGVRMEKRIVGRTRPAKSTQYYAQTTPFTCGPSALLMALAALKPAFVPTRQEELQLWRESTTIYMTSGHGGCSPVGLMLSALKRGLSAELYLSSDRVPFLDSVRDTAKREVIEVVHQQFMHELETLGLTPRYSQLSSVELAEQLNQGKVAICLISTWRLNRNKAPHWVLATGSDGRHIYFSDPDHEEEFWHSEADFVDVPIALEQYEMLARYGKSRFSATLLLSA